MAILRLPFRMISQRMAAAVRGAGFARVTIDLRGFRSGSLNVLGGGTGAILRVIANNGLTIPSAGTMPAKIHLSTEEKPVKPDGKSTLLVLDPPAN